MASRYAVEYHAQPQTLERSRILSLLPAAAEDMLRAKDAVARHEQWGYPGFPLLPITSYSSVLTTEEARALAQALDDAGLKRQNAANGLVYSFEIPGTSVDPPRPEKGPVETWSSSRFGSSSRTASRSARRAGERQRIDRLQAHDAARVESASATNPEASTTNTERSTYERLVIGFDRRTERDAGGRSTRHIRRVPRRRSR